MDSIFDQKLRRRYFHLEFKTLPRLRSIGKHDIIVGVLAFILPNVIAPFEVKSFPLRKHSGWGIVLYGSLIIPFGESVSRMVLL